MAAKIAAIFFILFFLVLFCPGYLQASDISLWERHCAACHDGKTVLDGKVVMSKEQMKSKYKTLEEFSNVCTGSASPSCMNILKHNKKLFIEVGREMGMKQEKVRR